MWLWTHRKKLVFLAGAAAGTFAVYNSCHVWLMCCGAKKCLIAHNCLIIVHTYAGVFLGGKYVLHKISKLHDGQRSAQLQSLR